MKILFSCLLFVFVFTAFSQEKAIGDTLYYNKIWQQVSSKNEAKYSRVYTQNGDVIFENDFYFPSNQLKKKGAVIEIKPTKCHGIVRWFYQDGSLSRQAIFKEGKKIGSEVIFYKNGNPQEQIFHRDTLRLVGQMWDEDNKPLLKFGTGTVTDFSEKDNSYTHKTFRDSICTESYERRITQNDTIFNIVDQRATYKGGGLSKFYSKLSNQIVYPENACRMGVEGKVYVQFIVNKQGIPEEVKTVKGIYWECDEEAERVVRKLKKWNCASHNGLPVKTRMVLPVIFKLN